MRKLMWFTMGFTAACAVGAYLISGFWLVLLASFCFPAAVLLFILKPKWGKVTAVILSGLCAGLLWFWGYDSLYLQSARQYDGETVSAVVTVSDYSYDTDYGVAADGTIELEAKAFRVRVYLSGIQQLSPGDEVQGDFRLRMTTQDAEKGSTYHQGEGIFLLAHAGDESVVNYADQVPSKYLAAMLRQQITGILDAAFPEDTLAFARALLLGDSTLLTYEEDTAFKLSGIRHVIAVSGLHMSILFSLVYFISGKKRVITTILGIPILLLFAAVAGFTPSIVRACIMQILMILALLFKKEYDPPTALSFAVMVMLLVNPLTITSVSFQLSVGCLVGIFLFYHRINGFLLRHMGQPKGMSVRARLIRWLAGSVSVSLSAMVATTPLSAFYFGTISLVGVLTNLLTLFVVSFIFYGIMLVCVLGAAWLPAARIAAAVVSWPVRYVLFMAKILSDFPLSAVYTCSSYIVIWLVLCYVLFAVFLGSKRKRPVMLLSCALAGLILAVAASWIEPRLDHYRVTVLDVGQGQSILLQCDGKNYLVDCGGDDDESAADTAAQMLLSQGITSLDGLILTHYDTDHAGGVEPLLTRIEADTLYLPDIPDDTGTKDTFEAQYTDRISWIRTNTVLEGDSMTLSLFAADNAESENESSLCILFQTENCDILITGERNIAGEKALMESVLLPELELLVVGHHGSRSSTGLELLSATTPLAAVISVGENNSYGHPADEVLRRLQLFGCSIWRTDLDGTVIFRG